MEKPKVKAPVKLRVQTKNTNVPYYLNTNNPDYEQLHNGNELKHKKINIILNKKYLQYHTITLFVIILATMITLIISQFVH